MSWGPEKATFIERLAGIFRLPYYFGCLIITLLLGPPGALILAYFSTGFDIGKASLITINFIVGVGTPYWIGVAMIGIVTLLLFYVFYMTKFMRQRLLSAEEKLTPIMPEGEQSFHESFRLVSKHWPPIALTIAAMAFFFIISGNALFEGFMTYAINIADIIYMAIVIPIWFLACCSFAWVYFGSVYGLHKLGQKKLRMKTSSEDRMLGVKPFGDLSLSLSIVYFSAVAILMISGIVGTVSSPLIGIIAFDISLIIFFAVGVALFIAPIYGVHKKMLEQKELEKTLLRRQAYKGAETKLESGQRDTISDIQQRLDNLTSMMTFELAEKSLNSVPNWPIDAPIMSKFFTILISVTAILLANFLWYYLKP